MGLEEWFAGDNGGGYHKTWRDIKRGANYLKDKLGGVGGGDDGLRDPRNYEDLRGDLKAFGAGMRSPYDKNMGYGSAYHRSGQNQALGRALMRARGENLVSDIQARQGAARAVQGAQALAAGARPGQAAAAARNAAVQGGSALSAMAGQRALAGAQEAAQNVALAGNIANQARGQDMLGAQNRAMLEIQRRQQLLEALRQRGVLSTAGMGVQDKGPSGMQKLLTVGGAVIGGYYGGPKGAAVGAAAGDTLGS